MQGRSVRAALVGGALVMAACASWSRAEPSSERELEERERNACAGVPAETQDADPFSHGELVESVTPLTDTEQMGKATLRHLSGAEILMRATPGVTPVPAR